MHRFEQFFTVRIEQDTPDVPEQDGGPRDLISICLTHARARGPVPRRPDVPFVKFCGDVLSDNKWGVKLRVSHRLLLKGCGIVGSSEIFRDHIVARSLKLRPYGHWDHTGLVMPPACSPCAVFV